MATETTTAELLEQIKKLEERLREREEEPVPDWYSHA